MSSHLLARQGQRMRKKVCCKQLCYNLWCLYQSLFLLLVFRDVFQRTIHIVGFRVLMFKEILQTAVIPFVELCHWSLSLKQARASCEARVMFLNV